MTVKLSHLKELCAIVDPFLLGKGLYDDEGFSYLSIDDVFFLLIHHFNEIHDTDLSERIHVHGLVNFIIMISSYQMIHQKHFGKLYLRIGYIHCINLYEGENLYQISSRNLIQVFYF